MGVTFAIAITLSCPLALSPQRHADTLTRLGLEIEMPMLFHAPLGTGGEPVPRDQIEGLEPAGMDTFMVDTVRHGATAIGDRERVGTFIRLIHEPRSGNRSTRH